MARKRKSKENIEKLEKTLEEIRKILTEEDIEEMERLYKELQKRC